MNTWLYVLAPVALIAFLLWLVLSDGTPTVGAPTASSTESVIDSTWVDKGK